MLFQEALRTCNDETAFTEGWMVTGGRFKYLRTFCGELASAFPNTATVESDFSVLGWEKDVYRTSLTDFSLEGILYCKQLSELRTLLKKLSNSSDI